ncbi:uncharacterized protein Gadd45 [Venturia canescens]|uniref:uncharacterized protein Gadd45 n=1 Tax=Venturia canescens TaxID=32260 RepID=UPI001C9D1937|nr:uncharacterized protein LOC122407334 [Venturia canescens]
MTCQGLQSFSAASNDSGLYAWKVQAKDLRRQWKNSNKITCGMLPTLRVLASQGCENQGSICFVPLEDKMDSGSHMQMTLLEAYCRESGIEVIRISETSLRSALGPEHSDLSCVLVSNDSSFFLETPE